MHATVTIKIRRVWAVLLCCLLSLAGCATQKTTSSEDLARIVTKDGRHMMLVDSQPFLMLGVQTNNSANYAAALPDVWPVVEATHANTLGIPVAWEQIEPVEGQFDFTFVDTLISQARERDVKLVLLWFGTWKNNAPHYAPSWVKLDNERFPRVVKQDGDTLNSLSPHFRSTLEADKKAFVAFMEHLKKVDKGNNVILVQVENEVGTYGSARDFSPTAEALFAGAVPDKLVADLGKQPGTWREVFGSDADEFFHAYHIAAYVDEIAAAGKAVHPVPMNVNVALRNPFNPGKPGQYSSGGPTDNVIDVWKSAAPHIDMISPDIYFRDHRTVEKVLDLYAREDNPLFVAEIGNDQPFARYFFSTLGHQGIGFAPFGMDYTDYANYPLGAKEMNEDVIGYFSELYELMRPWSDVWAELSFNNNVWGVAEPDSNSGNDKKIWNAESSGGNQGETPEPHTQNLDLGRWNAEVTYGRPMFWIEPPTGNDPPSGGVLIAQLGPDEYLVTGYRARVTFSGSAELGETKTMIERVEEGHFENGKWVFERVWNGDATDWGLNFTSRPHILKVKMATYSTK
jgi:beta-galactosidase GanA